jgi:hypothetical protein
MVDPFSAMRIRPLINALLLVIGIIVMVLFLASLCFVVVWNLRYQHLERIIAAQVPRPDLPPIPAPLPPMPADVARDFAAWCVAGNQRIDREQSTLSAAEATDPSAVHAYWQCYRWANGEAVPAPPDIDRIVAANDITLAPLAALLPRGLSLGRDDLQSSRSGDSQAVMPWKIDEWLAASARFHGDPGAEIDLATGLRHALAPDGYDALEFIRKIGRISDRIRLIAAIAGKLRPDQLDAWRREPDFDEVATLQAIDRERCVYLGADYRTPPMTPR